MRACHKKLRVSRCTEKKERRNLEKSDLFFQRTNRNKRKRARASERERERERARERERERERNETRNTRTRNNHVKPVQLSHVHHPQTCFFSIGHWNRECGRALKSILCTDHGDPITWWKVRHGFRTGEEARDCVRNEGFPPSCGRFRRDKNREMGELIS